MGISLQQGWQQLANIPVICLEHGQQHCAVSLYGGHVLRYFDGNHERLWLSETAMWTNGHAIRGGIPICWPWFGPYPQSQLALKEAAPNHGLVRTRMWQLIGFENTEAAVVVTLGIVVKDIPWESQEVTLRCQVTLDETGLTVRLQSDKATLQQAALHSYFCISSLENASVTGLSTQYNDKVTQRLLTDESGRCDFSTEVDRVYLNTADQLTVNSGLHWQLQQAGHDASVVWNPGEIKGSTAKDIQQQWQEFICVETASLCLEIKTLDVSQHIPKL